MPQLFRFATFLLVFCLFTIGSIPATGQAFPGLMHYAAHLMAYAVIAFSFGFGWPKINSVLVAIIVAAIGCFHEFTEIVTHHHSFEANDVVINALGATIGVIILILLRKLKRREVSEQTIS
jgi:VanZ family protein